MSTGTDAPRFVYHLLIEHEAQAIELSTHNLACCLHSFLKGVLVFDTEITTPGFDPKEQTR